MEKKIWFCWFLPSRGYWDGETFSGEREDAKLFPSYTSAGREDLRQGKIIQLEETENGLKVIR
jgi:hypothetical protein